MWYWGYTCTKNDLLLVWNSDLTGCSVCYLPTLAPRPRWKKKRKKKDYSILPPLLWAPEAPLFPGRWHQPPQPSPCHSPTLPVLSEHTRPLLTKSLTPLGFIQGLKSVLIWPPGRCQGPVLESWDPVPVLWLPEISHWPLWASVSQPLQAPLISGSRYWAPSMCQALYRALWVQR